MCSWYKKTDFSNMTPYNIAIRELSSFIVEVGVPFAFPIGEYGLSDAEKVDLVNFVTSQKYWAFYLREDCLGVYRPLEV